METENKTIEQASKILGPDTYEPFYVGYFVTQDGQDQGGEDYCKNCIEDAVKDFKNQYYKKRREVVAKFDEIEKTGFFKGVNIKEKYSDDDIQKAKEKELEEYPKPTSFDYQGHDPDFSGGNTEPQTCQGCGEYFYNYFTPDLECAKYLLEDFNNEIDERLKWKLSVAFDSFDYCEPDVQNILLQIAEILINPNTSETTT